MIKNITYLLTLGTFITLLISPDVSAEYLPSQGRFLQRDPFITTDLQKSRVPGLFSSHGGIMWPITIKSRVSMSDNVNLLNYVASNPINRMDPFGLEYRIVNGPYGPQWNEQDMTCEIYFTIDYGPSWYDYISPWYSPDPSSKRSYPLNGVNRCECNRNGLQRLDEATRESVNLTIKQTLGIENALTEGYNNADVTAQGLMLASCGMIVSGGLQIRFNTIHVASHMKEAGLVGSECEIQQAIANDISRTARGGKICGHFHGKVNVCNTTIKYHGFPLDNGTINVGTYYVPKTLSK